MLLPRPPALDLDLERETKERPDHHDPRENRKAVQGRIDRHGVDDVGGDEELQPEQDAPAQVLAELSIGIGLPPAGRDEP